MYSVNPKDLAAMLSWPPNVEMLGKNKVTYSKHMVQKFSHPDFLTALIFLLRVTVANFLTSVVR